jgi:hypothetical protein
MDVDLKGDSEGIVHALAVDGVCSARHLSCCRPRQLRSVTPRGSDIERHSLSRASYLEPCGREAAPRHETCCHKCVRTGSLRNAIGRSNGHLEAIARPYNGSISVALAGMHGNRRGAHVLTRSTPASGVIRSARSGSPSSVRRLEGSTSDGPRPHSWPH